MISQLKQSKVLKQASDTLFSSSMNLNRPKIMGLWKEEKLKIRRGAGARRSAECKHVFTSY